MVLTIIPFCPAIDKIEPYIVKYLTVYGRIAQPGEHSPYKAGVTGSIPVPPTI